MQKSFTSRILTVLLVAVMLLGAFCIAVAAEDLTFDLTTYADTAAVRAEWTIHKPNGVSGSASVSKSEGRVGMYESVTKNEAAVNNELHMTWNIPVEKQFKIKDFGGFEFKRRSSNGGTLLDNYGTEYKFVFTMDDGQTLTRTFPWYDTVRGYSASACVVTDEGFQTAVAGLKGDPTVVSIAFYPYTSHPDYYLLRPTDIYKPAVKDDPATEDVDETQASQPGSDQYNQLYYLSFKDAAEMPTGLVGVIDSWDGTEADVHDGKITGLDAEKTYKYAPIHSLDADFVTVTGVTEITGLVGGVYEVFAVEEGILDSDAVIVIIPKVTQGSYDNYLNNTANNLMQMKSPVPVSGYWTNPTRGSVTSAKYIATFYSKTMIAGLYSGYTNHLALTDKANEYYRRNVPVMEYAFTPEQQFDVDTGYFKFGAYMNNVHYPWNGIVNLKEHPITAALYIYVNGDMENPAVRYFQINQLTSVSEVNVDLSAEFDGYVTSIKYVQFYDIPDKSLYTTVSSGDGYHFVAGITTIPFGPSTFAPEAGTENDGSFAITGLDETKEYLFSTDNSTWQTITGVSKVKDLTVGTYYIQEQASLGVSKSEVFTFEIKGAVEFTGAPVIDGKVIKGLDENTQYEISSFGYNGASEWVQLEVGTTETAELDFGLYGIRVVAADGYFESATQYFLISGSEKYGSIAYNKYDSSRGWVAGYWTSAIGNGFTNYVGKRVLSGGSVTEYDTRLNMTYRYVLEAGEIRPINAIADMNFFYVCGNGNPWVSSKFTARFRFHVAGGDVDYYDIFVDHSFNVSAVVSPSSVIPFDAKGYLTAIEIHPVWDVVGSKELNGKVPAPYPVFYIEPYDLDPDITDVTSADKYRVNIAAVAAPQGLKVEKGVDGYYKGYKITGLDANAAYEIKDPTGKVTAVELGVTEITDVVAGVYSLRYATTDTLPASGWCDIFVPMINPVFGREGSTIYASVASDTFVENKWVVNPYEKMYFETASNVFYVGGGTTLSKLYTLYTFAEADRFVIDEHPYIYADFRNEMVNMAIVTAYIKDAIAAVDVYVEGEDEPYTVTTPWKGYAWDANACKTFNQMIVNILDLCPEIAGKTVMAVKFRPYSNIDLTPNDYNTTATAGRYMYFRMYGLGFFDTPANVQALTKLTNERVNTLTGLRAEADIIYAIGAKPTASEFTVYELYSDGTEREIKTFDVEVADDFAQNAGTATVTIKARGFETEVEVAVGLESIAIKSAPAKTEYFDGDALDLTGLEIVAILGNGEQISVTKFTTNVETATLGTTTVTVMYGGKEATFDITVKEVVLDSIVINSWPDKELAGGYLEGDPVDLTGLTVKAIYNNGYTEVLGLDKIEAVYGAEVMTRGTTLTVSYGGKILSGLILTVNSKAISEITITTPAEKTVYMVGEELDITGLELTVNYEDGSSEVVTKGFIADADLSEAGEVVVSVLYEGFTLEYTVTVRTIDSAFIMTPPTKTEYVVGEELDTEGLELYVLYSDGEEAYLTEGF
ncbi:MAG: bacterial Ig-like domain-containing protein, partial [Clostridia bacterium]|nr:bacterial Ig-like domain-containing protein [Clostridia bacterium]